MYLVNAFVANVLRWSDGFCLKRKPEWQPGLLVIEPARRLAIALWRFLTCLWFFRLHQIWVQLQCTECTECTECTKVMLQYL